MANFNSLVLDFVARQKVQGQHLNLYILEQFPVLDISAYKVKIADKKSLDLIKSEVLKLTYTAEDMRAFAQDMGYSGEPFPWNEEERLHSRARLDALYFLLYGLSRDDAAYVLDTFPIVKEQDEDKYGCYRSKELVLGYMAAFEAGDSDSRISG